jgi:mono/diheme cytochrome c family protein
MNTRKRALYLARLLVLVLGIALLSGCTEVFAFRRWMYDQPKASNQEGNQFFEDGRSMRPLVENTVPVDPMRLEIVNAELDDFFYTGMIDGEEVDLMPFPVTQAVLDRGEQQYNIYCAPCHGLTGYGNGMVARRGGTPPANYHSEYVRNQTLGHYYNVITNGYRNMWAYDQKIEPADRWAISAYIRALQLSQNAPADVVPAEELQQLEQQGTEE